MPVPEDAYIKQNVSLNEFILARIVGNAGIANTPDIIDYDEILKIMKMKKLNDCISLADFYGDDDTDIPENMYEEVRNIIKKLTNIGIDYVDITGYNFMVNPLTMKLYIIDFEHAYVRNPTVHIDSFIESFINGFSGWNPQFK